jgi:hypothetical protein
MEIDTIAFDHSPRDEKISATLGNRTLPKAKGGQHVMFSSASWSLPLVRGISPKLPNLVSFHHVYFTIRGLALWELLAFFAVITA